MNPTRNYSVLISVIQKILTILNQVKQVHLVWVRGHVGITGNDNADRTAKQGHHLDNITETPLTYSELISKLNSRSLIHWEKMWKERVHNSGVGRHLLSIRDNIRPWPWTKQKDRRMEVVMNRLRMGHAGINSYLYRFDMADSEECPHCHMPETIQHFFFDCPEYEAPRLNMIRELQSLADAPLTIKTLLGGCNLPHRTNFKIASKVACYIKATNRIQDL